MPGLIVPQMSRASPDENARASTRRRSGRVVKAPETIYPSASSPNGPPKRKRGEDEEGDDDIDLEDASDDDDEETEPDEDEKKNRRRKGQRGRKPGPRPAAKKAKANGGVTLAIRTAAPRSRKIKKATIRDEAGAEAAGGLYGKGTCPALFPPWLTPFDS